MSGDVRLTTDQAVEVTEGLGQVMAAVSSLWLALKQNEMVTIRESAQEIRQIAAGVERSITAMKEALDAEDR